MGLVASCEADMEGTAGHPERSEDRIPTGTRPGPCPGRLRSHVNEPLGRVKAFSCVSGAIEREERSDAFCLRNRMAIDEIRGLLAEKVDDQGSRVPSLAGKFFGNGLRGRRQPPSS